MKAPYHELGCYLEKFCLRLADKHSGPFITSISEDIKSHYFQTQLFKMFRLLWSLVYLLKQADEQPHFILSINIILRTLLNDTIFLFYVSLPENDKERINSIQEIYTDHLYFVFSEFKFLTDNSFEKKEVINHQFEEMHLNFPEFFNAKPNLDNFKKTLLFYKKGLSLKSVVKKIKNDVVFTAYSLFMLLSKTEHTGLYTFELIQRFNREKLDFDSFSIIEESLRLILRGYPLIGSQLSGMTQIEMQWHKNYMINYMSFREFINTNRK
jgi:hypothetical protein